MEIPGAVMDPVWPAVLVAAITLLIVFGWPKAWGMIVPSPLVALIVGTLISLVLPGAPILGDIPTGLPAFILPAISMDTIFIVLEAAIILALLGAIDSLLTSLVADNMTRSRHDSNRELIGQGVGNMAAGFFGGIPGAGATMRTVVNIRTGGRTRISGMVHSALLLTVVISLAPLAEKIPHAVLAGILVKVGYDILDISYLKQAHRGPRWDLLLMAIVLTMTVFVDLIAAVATGVVLAALAFVKQMADAQLAAFGGSLPIPLDTSPEEAALLRQADRRVTLFDFGGPLSFGAAADLGHHVRERVKGGRAEAMVLDFSRVPFVDVSAARAVETVGCDARRAGRRVFVSGMNPEVRNTLASLDADHCLPKDGYYATRVEALRAALAYVESSGKTPVDEGVGEGGAHSPKADAALPGA